MDRDLWFSPCSENWHWVNAEVSSSLSILLSSTIGIKTSGMIVYPLSQATTLETCKEGP
jgi:hypothetical protein